MKILFVLPLLFLACTREEPPLGSEKNPVKLFFVPSIDTNLITEKAQDVKRYLEQETPYKYKVSVPNSYIAVVEAFGTKRADVSTLNTFSYILAYEKYGTQALITTIRFGKPTYQGQIIARADSKVKTIKDIAGKRFAFVDPASTSGYLLPKKLFIDNHIKPSETVFAQKHDNVVTMVYNKQVDAGATYHTPSENGKINDARKLVKTQFPDVEEKVKIIYLTEPIPNDPIVFRKDLPEEMKNIIADAFIKYVTTSSGKDTLNAIFSITALKRSTDKDYDEVRIMLKKLGETAEGMIKKQ
ncbi:MAG: phosphate/phosphite/phosphonate ABC transporter substrate-binding protein [Pseudomonadota bacterium]|nr:phosphate/phosphite/phosphonate ABC transporter substrate-binding protein [Pseudomonadota bacterium]